MLYVDGFAGPGEYEGGEDGSPIIALKVAKDHKLRDKLQRPDVELVFIFIEKDEARYLNLKQRIAELQLPGNFRTELTCDTFEHAFGSLVAKIVEQNKRLAPSFVFIDPFGPTGFPMSLITLLAKQRSLEVLITFNYQALNEWFLQVTSKHKYLDALYGSDIWRQALDISNSREKEHFLRKAYHNALEDLRWKVRPFRMINRHNQTQYYLFFATSNWRGMLAMKQAMWSAAPKGDFQYSDLTSPQQPLLFEEFYHEEYSCELADQLYKALRGETIPKQIILEQEVAWHPICIGRQLTRALRILEYESVPPRIINVELPNRTRRGKTYPDDCTLTFAP